MSNKKRILIHSLVFSPDGVSTAYLYNDLAIGFQKAGFDVVVLTTTPHYNVIPEALRKQPLQKKWGGLFYISDFNGIKVIHIYQKKYRQTVWRLTGFFYWHVLAFFIGVSIKRTRLIISPSPPLSIGLINLFIGFFKRAKVVYNVQEIYPDFLINQGNLKSGTIIRLLKWLEKTVYNYSDAVVTIDQLFYNTILGRVKERSKLHKIPNFVDTELYKPTSIDVLNIELFSFEDRLKVMYAGNIGYAQDWEPLLSIAEKVKESPVVFYVIGEGVLKRKLEEDVNERSLPNIKILPYQPRALMPAIVSYADLHFIFMNPQMEEQGFPSKVYTIMACGKPLLVISGEHTPLYSFLKNKPCAKLICQESDKVEQATIFLEEAIRKNGMLNRMGKAAMDDVIKNYSKEVVFKQYEVLVRQLIEA